jgi:prolyl-tRNA editing enzyme YbaK/EbsC (Cys-tRNA(Pro) deacylase)
MAEHNIFHDILAVLKQDGCWHESFEHGTTVRTSEEAAALRPDYTLSEGAKALIVRLKIPHKGKSFAMAVLPGDKKFDSKKLKQAAGASDLRFATEAEVAELTNGIQPGGVPPFGNLFGVAVYADNGVFTNEKIIFNAGRDVSIAMKSADYKRIVQPTVATIV